MTTESQKHAIQKYLAKMTTLTLRLPPDEVERMKIHADRNGVSLRQYIRQTMAAQMDREDKAE